MLSLTIFGFLIDLNEMSGLAQVRLDKYAPSKLLIFLFSLRQLSTTKHFITDFDFVELRLC